MTDPEKKDPDLDIPVPPRDELVKTAVKFLSNNQIVNSSNEKKLSFLKKKGLSEAEIQLAFDQADYIIQNRAIANYNAGQTQPQTYLSPWPYQSKLAKYRDLANSIALLGGLAYAVYWFYKKYVYPFLFGEKKNLETRLKDLDKGLNDSIGNIKVDMARFKEEIDRQSERRTDFIIKQIEDLRGDVQTIKKLMLSKNQFPSAPSIPAWQMEAAKFEEKETEKEGSTGTNGSDSSLEMIKE